MSDIQGDGFSEVLPEAEPARAVIGHNSGAVLPELPSTDLVRQVLGERHAKLFQRAKDLIAAEARMPKDDKNQLVVETDADEKKFSDTVRLIQGAVKDLDTARTAEKSQWDNIADAVHGLFREFMDQLVDPNATKSRPGNALKHRLEGALTRYKLKREEEARARAQAEADALRAKEDAARKEAEDAQRAVEELAAKAARARKPENKAEIESQAQSAAASAAELAAKATDAGDQRSQAEAIAAAPAADLTRARGGYSVSSLREFLDVRDFDHAKLPAITLWPYIAADAKEKAVRAYLNANSDPIKEKLKNKQQPLTGCTFFINHRTDVR